jgi:hypothetical protein
MTNLQLHRFNHLMEEMMVEQLSELETREYLNLLKLWNLDFEYQRSRATLIKQMDLR